MGTSKMPISQLPETFELDTTMNIHDEEWSVQDANPIHSKDFRKTKRLTLRLSKVEYMNPKDLLYSLPTISDELPGTTDSNSFSGESFSILEDDWRQFEFLKKSSSTLIEIECSKIEELKKEHSRKVDDSFTAFTNCHVRDSIGHPELEVELSDLQEVLSVAEVGGLQFHGSSLFVNKGFSLTTPKSVFFGLVEDGIVQELCIGDLTDGTRKEVELILQNFDLLFVNWYHAEVVSRDD